MPCQLAQSLEATDRRLRRRPRKSCDLGRRGATVDNPESPEDERGSPCSMIHRGHWEQRDLYVYIMNTSD